jgi:hypothetical protein
MSDERQTEHDDVEIVENAAPAPCQAAADTERRQLEAKFRGGANWFFWIAALSVINSVILLAEGDRQFVVGLGITQVANGVALAVAKQAPDSATLAKGIGFAFTCLAAGFFAAIGAGSRKRWVWVFAIGIVSYILDGILLLLFQDWMSFAFHLFALFGIFGGLSACRKLNAMELGMPEPGIESAS